VYLVYQILLTLALIITSPYFFIIALLEKHGIRERLGDWAFKSDDRKVIWFHAASMGELKAISSVLPELTKAKPELRVVISTMTKTGKTRARKLFDPIEIYYIPIDLKFFVRRVIKRVRPSVLVLVETEIWPVLIAETSRADVKLAVINARISHKSLKLYRILGVLFKPVVEKFDIVMTQTEKYSKRFIALGARPENVAAMGNMKFDQILDFSSVGLSPELDRVLNRHDKFVFIAGSIWPNEFEKMIQAVKKARDTHPELIAVLAPRHMKNLPKLEEALSAQGISYIKRSSLSDKITDANILILDTMGELSSLYRYADLAFVGGSLVKIGGHDPLEPASSGCPTCFGPHMENSQIFVDILLNSGGAFYINDELELEKLIKKMLSDKSLAKELGRKAEQTVLDHSGVSGDIARKLAELF